MEAGGSPNNDAEEVIRRFHHLYYTRPHDTWLNTYWLGIPVLKSPLDMWIYHEILFQNRPDVVVESGTYHGGSAHFLACICDLVGSGRVITIDLPSGPEVPKNPAHPVHDRLTYVSGSSVAEETLAEVAGSIRPGEQVMVILDSDHHKDHVLSELRAYAPMVSNGHYLIVEDTNINGNPVLAAYGPGPREAVEEFLGERDDFVVDSSREKYFLTFNPGGFLKRVK